jgi:hypothetical protein
MSRRSLKTHFDKTRASNEMVDTQRQNNETIKRFGPWSSEVTTINRHAVELDEAMGVYRKGNKKNIEAGHNHLISAWHAVKHAGTRSFFNNRVVDQETSFLRFDFRHDIPSQLRGVQDESFCGCFAA